MCFAVSSCLFCIRLETATKIIAFIYMIVSAALSMLFVVPLAVLGDELPLARIYFYSGMAISSVALFITSCLLVYAEFRKTAKLMWPWVSAAWSTSLLLGVLCVVGMITVSYRASNFQEAADESSVISVYFTHALLLFYFSCVVNSRREELLVEGYTEANKRLMYPIMYNVNSV